MNEHTRRISRRAFLGGAVTFGTLSLVNPTLAFATPSSAEKQAEADTVRVQVSAMQQELNRASEDYYTALTEHDVARTAMDESQSRIDETNTRISSLQDSLSQRARSMYRSGGTSFYDILLGATSFEEFANNWGLLNKMNEDDAAMVQETKELRAELEIEKAEYSRQEKIAAEKTKEASRIKTQAEATVAEMTAVLDSLDAEARAILEQEQQAAAEAAAAVERAAMEAATVAQSTNDTGSDGGTSGESSARSGVDNSGGSSGSVISGGGSAGGGPTGGGNPSGGGGYTGTSSGIPAKSSVVDYAVSRLGCPYVWGATGPNSFDCSGLTSWCYAQIGINITRTTYSQIKAAKAILPVSSAEPGDVLHKSGHVGICTAYGGGQYIHAPQPGEAVKYSNWSQFNCALRF